MADQKKESSGVNVLELILLIAKHKVKFISIIGSITIIALIVSLVWPHTFKSSFSFVQYNNTPDGALGGVINEIVQLSSASGRVTSDQAVILLQSRSLKDEVIEKFNLQEVYGQEVIEYTRQTLSNNVQVEETREGGIGFSPIVSVSVSVYDEDPERAKAMAEFYLAKLDSFMVEINKNNARDLLETYRERYEQNKMELRQAEEAFMNFQETYGIMELESQMEAMIKNLGELKAKLVELEVKKNVARNNLSEDAPQYQQLVQQQQELQKVYNSQIQKSDDIIREETQDQEIFPSMLEVPSLGVQYYRLYRELTVQERIYELIYPQYEQQKMLYENVSSGIRTIDAPNLPTYKDSPKRAYIVIAGFFLSIFIAFISIFFSEFKEKGKEEQTENYQLYKKIKSELFSKKA